MKKTIIIIAILVLIGILGFVAYSFLASSKVPQAFVDKHNEIATLDDKATQLADLKALTTGISNAEVKTSADKFIEIAKKANSSKISYNDLQIQMAEKTKTMIGILIKNSKAISAADEKAINDLSKEIDGINSQFDNAEIEVDKVQSQYKEAE